MMRIGVDVHDVDQTRESLVLWGDRYRRRLFTDAEVRQCGGWGASAERAAAALAARFAAKEAAIKALPSTGAPPGWHDIEVVDAPSGPVLRLSGRAAALAREDRISTLHLSIARTRRLTIATVLAA